MTGTLSQLNGISVSWYKTAKAILWRFEQEWSLADYYWAVEATRHMTQNVATQDIHLLIDASQLHHVPRNFFISLLKETPIMQTRQQSIILIGNSQTVHTLHYMLKKLPQGRSNLYLVESMIQAELLMI